MPTRATMLTGLALAAMLIVGGSHESTHAEELTAQALDRELSVERGAKVFRRACAACHGRNGQGDGPGAADLKPPPRDLTSRSYRFRTTPNGELPRPEDLERTIRHGLPGSDMPAFDDLFSRKQLDDLIQFIYSLQPPEVFDGTYPAVLPMGPVSAKSPNSERDGRAIYLIAGCWRCHGINGAGNGPSAKTLVDEQDNKLPSTNFRYAPYKGGRTPEAVVRTLRTGLNGSAMPSYDEAMMISNEDVGDTVSIEDRMDEESRKAVEAFLSSSPTPQALAQMTDDQKAELRDRRLADLAYYVLSRRKAWSVYPWLFRERPWKEPRKVDSAQAGTP